MEKQRIGLLTPFFQPIPAYAQPAAELGVDLVIVTPPRIDWQKQQVEALLFDGGNWIQQTVPLPRAYYNRFYGPKPKVVNRLELLVGRNKVFNHITRFDKLAVHQALDQSDLQDHLPKTYPYGHKRLLQLLAQGKQVILKLRTGQLGTGIYLIRKKGRKTYVHLGTSSPLASFSSAEELLAWLEVVADDAWLLQEFISLARLDGRPFDVRILVQKDGCGNWLATAALSRTALRYSYVTNLSHAILPASSVLSQVFPGLRLLPKLEALSLRAAAAAEQALGSLGEISVDFGLDQEGRIWIIELNGKPMKTLFRNLEAPELVNTVYAQPLRYALHLCSPGS